MYSAFMDVKYIHDKLASAGIAFSAGITPDEFEQIQNIYGFAFPPDLREFLSLGIPDSKRWLNWRTDTEQKIRERMAWPLDSMCFDIEHSGFWLPEWGPKPARLQDAFEVARQALLKAPTLIPIYAHLYIPAEPHLPGNPIFSVWQTDIIYYGANLVDYLQNEFHPIFGRAAGNRLTGEPRRIEFWSMMTELD